MNIVLDTNILVSAAWSPGKNAATILKAVFAGKFTACYDSRILNEYIRVLHYKKLGFTETEINAILDPLIKYGMSVIPDEINNALFDRDESDRKFYETAKYCCAILITGNLVHYPADPSIMSPAEFCSRYLDYF
ncbi:MAG: putative toxin-antitoxin system toxin component, PIN family [Eubacteriales bacterium]|nr:putative toxin-antitoxin system toxin component, PIN family [Eubacteriales bacterium]